MKEKLTEQIKLDGIKCGRKFKVILEKDEDGWIVADVPELQGCHTQGKTKKEALKNIKECIGLCLADD